MMTRHVYIWLMIALCLIATQKGESATISHAILSQNVHQQNQLLCAQIIKKKCQVFPYSYTPQQRANALNLQLDVIARELLDQGLDLKAYTYDKCENSTYLVFARIPLWEGAQEGQPEIPLTLFLYVWPPENVAQQVGQSQQGLKNATHRQHYATNIHGHPLPCALSVLKGTLCQENYEAVEGWSFNVAKKLDDEILQPGTVTVDDNTTPFVHRIVCRDAGSEPAISLHGYGASTAQAVRKTFISNYDLYCYPYVLNEKGQLIHQTW